MSSDPRNPNYRGVECKDCGERLPFLLKDFCNHHCQHEKTKKETAELRELLQECMAFVSLYQSVDGGNEADMLAGKIQEKINE